MFFGGTVGESLEHLNHGPINFWCGNVNIKIEARGFLERLFGLWKRMEDYLLMNQVIINGKQYSIYVFIFVWVFVKFVIL